MNWLRGLSWPKRVLVAAGSLFFLFVAFLGIGYAVTDVPPPNKVAINQATRVLYADGGEMGRIGLQNRTIVPLSAMSKDAQHAVLAAEDRDFYSSPGISVKGIGRALFSNVKAGGVSQGGSTITQQYAKNAFLTSERTYRRKIKEVFISLKMSRTVPKDTILENYLNTIYFGRGAYGIQSAAKVYFGVDAKDLTAAQGAVLASSIKSPSLLDPTKHPERAKERWGYVLDGMVTEKWLSRGDRAAATYPRIEKVTDRNFVGSLSHVKDQVLADLGRQGFTEDRITAGGLVVQTTIFKRAQQAAIDAVEAQVKPSTSDTNHPVSALVSVQPGTGKVVAYYGGSSAGGFDYAADGKGAEPGSSMKPYVLAAALEKGTSVDSTLDGSSPQEICGDEIENDKSDPPFGQVDLATALQYSANTVYYRLACETGPQRVADAAHAAGVPDSQPLADPVDKKPTSQIALGADGYQLHPIDQAVGYATFAAKGVRARPYFVARVLDADGNELYKAKADTGKAFDEGVAADVVYAMQKVVEAGTGTNAKLDGRPAAGKTGTTTSGKNAWFGGFTPQLSTTVWIGMSKGGPIELGDTATGRGVYGGQQPAKIFKQYMDTVLQGADVLDFPPKAGVGSTDKGGSETPATSGPAPTGGPTSSPTPFPTVTVSLPPVIEPTQSSSPEPQPTQSQAPPPPPPTQSPAAQPTAAPTSSP